MRRAGLLLALVLVLAACNRPVVLVGDSILQSATDETVTKLGAGGAFRPTVEAVSGSGLGTCNGAYWEGLRWLDRIRALDAGSRPQILFVELGTGDWLCPEAYERDGMVDQVLGATRARVVVWMLPAAGPWAPDVRGPMERIRAVLQHAEWVHGGRLRLVDLNIVAEQPGSLDPDGIHLTPLGQTRLADVIRETLDSVSRGWG